MKSTLVSSWFGPQFGQLHPLLQRLHENGGVLAGEVELGFGHGIAGWLGRRLARGMGLPLRAARPLLEVDISHSDAALRWARRFSFADRSTATMVSFFEPVGHWPDGHWVERTGTLEFTLTVDVKDGGWHWRVLGARWKGLPLPVALLPHSRAFKRIDEAGDYRFEVVFEAPVLGALLWYRGTLQLQPRDVSGLSSPADSPRP